VSSMPGERPGQMEAQIVSHGLAVSGSAAKLAKARPKKIAVSLEKHGPRPSEESWPAGKARAIGLGDHLGETAIAGALATTFAAKLRTCNTLEEVQRVAVELEERVGKQQFTHRALVVAVNRRCCEILLLGWDSAEDAHADMKAMISLRTDTLLAPWKAVRQAVTSALLMFCGSRPAQPSQTGATRSDGPPSSPVRDARVQKSLHQWTLHAQVFSQFSEVGFLGAEEAAEVERQLDAELKQILAGVASQDLGRFAAYLRAGGSYVLRGRLAAVSGRVMAPETRCIPVADNSGLVPEVPTSVSVAAFEALRAAERAGGMDLKAAPAASSDLQHVGLHDPKEHKAVTGRRGSWDTSEGPPLPVPRSAEGRPVPRSADGRRALSSADLVRRAHSISAGSHSSVFGFCGLDAKPAPSHIRAEVEVGMGALGAIAARSGTKMTGLAPVGGSGMSPLQKTLLRVHASRADVRLGKPLMTQSLPQLPSCPALVARGRPPPLHFAE